MENQLERENQITLPSRNLRRQATQSELVLLVSSRPPVGSSHPEDLRGADSPSHRGADGWTGPMSCSRRQWGPHTAPEDHRLDNKDAPEIQYHRQDLI